MKKTMLVLAMATAILTTTSCTKEGAVGPAGKPGANGADGKGIDASKGAVISARIEYNTLLASGLEAKTSQAITGDYTEDQVNKWVIQEDINEASNALSNYYTTQAEYDQVQADAAKYVSAEVFDRETARNVIPTGMKADAIKAAQTKLSAATDKPEQIAASKALADANALTEISPVEFAKIQALIKIDGNEAAAQAAKDLAKAAILDLDGKKKQVAKAHHDNMTVTSINNTVVTKTIKEHTLNKLKLAAAKAKLDAAEKALAPVATAVAVDSKK